MSEIEQKQESAPIQRSGFSGMSITAFILSLFGFLLALPAVAGLILGILSLVRSSRDFRRRGLAIAAVVISALWIVFFGLVFLAAGSSDNPEKSSSTQAQEQVQETDISSPSEDVPSSPAAPFNQEIEAEATPSESTLDPQTSDGSLFEDMQSEGFLLCMDYNALMRTVATGQQSDISLLMGILDLEEQAKGVDGYIGFRLGMMRDPSAQTLSDPATFWQKHNEISTACEMYGVNVPRV